jgi:hypothetical protein
MKFQSISRKSLSNISKEKNVKNKQWGIKMSWDFPTATIETTRHKLILLKL